MSATWLEAGPDLLRFEVVAEGRVHVHGTGPGHVKVDVTLPPHLASVLEARATRAGYRRCPPPTRQYLARWFD